MIVQKFRNPQLLTGAVLATIFGCFGGNLYSQESSQSPSDAEVSTPPLAEGPPAVVDQASDFSTYTNLPARNLAPGVLVVVPPSQGAGDMTIGPQDLDFVAKHPELEWSPPQFPEAAPNTFPKSETLLEMGRSVTLRHPVWALEFAFKPMRLLKAQVPMPDGTLEDQLVWYLLYRVRYVGGDLMPNETAVEAGTGVPNPPKSVIYKSVRFLPRFTLISPEFDVEYDSQILSTVKSDIANRERVGKPLHDYMEMSAREILPVSDQADNSQWGIATWVGVDPRIDAFYIDVRGLTNAFQREINVEGKEEYRRKTLRIYFWKPGDTVNQEADRIRLGIPAFESPERQSDILKLFKIDEPLDYSWIYR